MTGCRDPSGYFSIRVGEDALARKHIDWFWIGVGSRESETTLLIVKQSNNLTTNGTFHLWSLKTMISALVFGPGRLGRAEPIISKMV
jgi:hypothetical protein